MHFNTSAFLVREGKASLCHRACSPGVAWPRTGAPRPEWVIELTPHLWAARMNGDIQAGPCRRRLST